MLAQGNALGFGIHRLWCALKERRALSTFRAGDGSWHNPGALPRTCIPHAVGVTTYSFFSGEDDCQDSILAITQFTSSFVSGFLTREFRRSLWRVQRNTGVPAAMAT